MAKIILGSNDWMRILNKVSTLLLQGRRVSRLDLSRKYILQDQLVA